MNREEILTRLRENEAALRRLGVAHAALFGSRARGDQQSESGTDILIEFDPAVRITVFDYAGLKNYIAGLFDGRVDVVNRDGLKPHVKPAVTAGAVYAFCRCDCAQMRRLATASQDGILPHMPRAQGSAMIV